MAKDTFYFKHDYNARNDRKISALVSEYKSSGYGIFWATCEMMHEEGDKLEFDDITFNSIARDLNEDKNLVIEVIQSCVTKFKLFIKDDILLTSFRVKRNLIGREEKKSAKIESGRLGGIKSGESRRTKQNEADLQANEADLEGTKQRRGEERKEEESKVYNIKEEEIKWNIKENNTEETIFDEKLWTQIVKDFYNDFNWKEKFCRDKNILLIQLENKQKNFISNIELREDFKTLKELKNHFTNTFNKEINGKKHHFDDNSIQPKIILK